MAEPKFFPTPAEFRQWFARNHERCDELWVGFYKKGTGLPSITWPESVDQALCYGWIDGIRKSIDDQAYMIRFTPRRKRSNWSTVNLKRIKELIADGLVEPAGLEAYQRRPEKSPAQYAYEQGKVELDPQYLKQIRANPKAWKYFNSLTPSYKKPSMWWVMSAKRESTRERRLQTLIECCERNEKIPNLVNQPRKKK